MSILSTKRKLLDCKEEQRRNNSRTSKKNRKQKIMATSSSSLVDLMNYTAMVLAKHNSQATGTTSLRKRVRFSGHDQVFYREQSTDAVIKPMQPNRRRYPEGWYQSNDFRSFKQEMARDNAKYLLPATGNVFSIVNESSPEEVLKRLEVTAIHDRRLLGAMMIRANVSAVLQQQHILKYQYGVQNPEWLRRTSLQFSCRSERIARLTANIHASAAYAP